MKYICLGCMAESDLLNKTEAQMQAMMDECFTYDEWLMEKGHFAGGYALQPASTATTLRRQGERVAITDGPFAETKEQLGGIMILEADDLNHAIQLMSNHPSTRMGGCWEIRPSADLDGLLAESRRRRGRE
jgi:hypothetical protein